MAGDEQIIAKMTEFADEFEITDNFEGQRVRVPHKGRCFHMRFHVFCM